MKTLLMDAVLMASFLHLVLLKKDVWSTQPVKTQGMDAAEMASRLLREATLRVALRMSVKIPSLVAVMMERLLPQVLERRASVLKTKNAKLESLDAALMGGTFIVLSFYSDD